MQPLSQPRRPMQDNTIADQPMLRLVEGLEHMLDVARHAGGAGSIGAGTQVRLLQNECNCVEAFIR